jgi:hypothetical protein
MRRIPFAVSACLFVISLASLAQASQRTFVSAAGIDGNPCSRGAPCRNFAAALSQTDSGGEVVVLDSAGYGAFTITQSVSIVAPPGVYAGVSVFSGNGIDVNTGSGAIVTLRGLTVNDQGSAGNGISFGNQGTLYVENCVVNGFNNSGGFGGASGLIFAPVGNSSALDVKDSTFTGNFNGIQVLAANAAIEHVRLEGNNIGLLAAASSIVAIRNSLAANNFEGLKATAASSANAELDIESCIASNNINGVAALSPSTGVATVRVSNSTVTANVAGLVNNGSPAVLLSRTNNTVEGNNQDFSGTIGSYTAK